MVGKGESRPTILKVIKLGRASQTGELQEDGVRKAVAIIDGQLDSPRRIQMAGGLAKRR